MPLPCPSRRCASALLIAVSLCAVGSRAARAQVFAPPPTPQEPAELRVLIFNTHLLPAIAQTVAGHRGQDDYRTEAIAKRIVGHDLIGLCEVFEASRRREIVRVVQEEAARQSQGAYVAVESPRVWGRSLIGSGLLLLSRYPLEGQPHFVTYKNASRVITSGIKADGLAAKGAIHARLRVGAGPQGAVDCFLTHLESISATARAAQIAELAAFVAEHASAERPAIVMGDMNVTADYPLVIGGEETEYGVLRRSLRVGDAPLADVWATLQPTRGGTSDPLAKEECRRIDYVFVSAGGALQPMAVRVELFLDAAVTQGSLSDHAGVECRFARVGIVAR